MLQDMRYGVRMLLKNRSYTGVALISLALGIGANTAIFSLIDSVMLQMLPVERPEQLVLFSRNNPVGGGESFTYPQFEQFRDHNQSFSSLFGFAYRELKVSAGNRVEPAVIHLASGQYFSALGVNAALGRTLPPAIDDRQATSEGAVAVISDRFWRRRFDRDPGIVGKSVVINDSPA